MTTEAIEDEDLTSTSENRAIGILSVSQGLQSFGSSLFAVSVALYAGSEQDFLGLGLILAARTLPTVIVSVLGGISADTYNKKTIAVLTLFLVALANFSLFWLILSSGLGLATHLVSFGAGLVTAFGSPALYALLPSVVSHERNFQANAIVRTFRNGGSVLGPLAVALIVMSGSALSSIWLSALCFLCAGVAMLALEVAPTAPKPKQKVVDDLRAAVRLSKKLGWLPVMIAFWAVFLAVQSGAYGVVQPVHATDVFGPEAWAIMSATLSIGYISASVIAARFPIKQNLLFFSVLFVLLSSTPNLVMGSSSVLWLWCVSAFFAGAGLEISGIAWGSALQTRIEPEHIGKVSSLDYAVSFGFIPLGYALFGVIATTLPSQEILLWSGVLLVGLGAGALALIAKQGYDKLIT